MPLDSSPTVDPVLGDLVKEFFGGREDFIADRVAVPFSAAQQSASFYVDEIENQVATPDNIVRGPGTSYGRLSMRLSSDTYNTVDRGIEVPVDDTERAKYRVAWDADEAALDKAVRTILLDREVRLAALMTGASVTAEAMTALDGTAGNGETFIKEVRAEIEEIRQATGIKPNKLILPITEWNEWLVGDIDLKARIANTGNNDMKEVTKEALANILGIDEILIPMGIKASTKDGQTLTTTDIWTQGEGYLFYSPPNGALLNAPASVRNFTWNEFGGEDDVTVTTYREEKIKSDVHQVFSYDDMKLVSANLTRQLTGL